MTPLQAMMLWLALLTTITIYGFIELEFLPKLKLRYPILAAFVLGSAWYAVWYVFTH